MANCRPGIVGVAFIAVLALPLCARAANDIETSRRNAIVRAIEEVSPAVVTINVVEIRAERAVDPFFSDFWGLFGPRSGRPRVRGRAVDSIGTGFLFDKQGHILTNYHVLQDADVITSVTLPDGRQLEVEFIGADERTDIAVLRAKGENLPHIPLGSSEDLLIGEWVIAIGNPFGNMIRDPQPSVSVGVVSANHRRVSRSVTGGDRLYQDLIQTDAAINPGNSGGPLVNARGEAVGINTMIFSSSGGHQGLGFAIPGTRAKRVASEIIKHGRRRNPWPGFHGEAVASLTRYSLRELDVRADSGVLVTEMLRECPAAAAGLRLGDVVTEVNGQPVSGPTDVDFIVWELFVGEDVEVKADRQGAPLTMTFQVKELRGP